MYLDAAVMDMEEALRTLTLIGPKAGHFDTHMHVTGQKQGEIKGESIRQHGDRKPYHSILGYYIAAGSPTDSASGSATGRRRYSAMRIVRSSDSSSASLMSAFAQNEGLTTVELNSYRAGGDDAKDALLMPPLNGKLRTPKLAFDDVELQGVEIELSDGPASGANSP